MQRDSLLSQMAWSLSVLSMLLWPVCSSGQAASGGETGEILAEQKAGTQRVLTSKGWIEVPDRTAIRLLGDTAHDCSHDWPDNSWEGESEPSCVELVGPTPTRALVEASHVYPAGSGRAVPGLTGWWYFHVSLDSDGDCPRSVTWRLGPDGQRAMDDNGGDPNPVSAQVDRGRVIWTRSTQQPEFCIAPLSEPLRETCYEGDAVALAPDGTVWFRRNKTELGPSSEDGKRVRRYKDVQRLVDGNPQEVWEMEDRVIQHDTLACQQRVPSVGRLQFSPDGRRIKVDGRWRKVPPVKSRDRSR